ncbi:MAG: hypothetical protein ACKO26_15340 [Planctomycetota bacterium]
MAIASNLVQGRWRCERLQHESMMKFMVAGHGFVRVMPMRFARMVAMTIVGMIVGVDHGKADMAKRVEQFERAEGCGPQKRQAREREKQDDALAQDATPKSSSNEYYRTALRGGSIHPMFYHSPRATVGLLARMAPVWFDGVIRRAKLPAVSQGFPFP